MSEVEVKFVSKSNNPVPSYGSDNSAGSDLYAFLDEPVILYPLNRILIPTGLFIELPVGWEGQVRPRSGLALKHGITVLNSPGTIDADYRGEIGVILINLSSDPFVINNGDRIAQLVISNYAKASWKKEESLNPSLRGKSGFGSTGK